jgi:hypothetical protein
MCIATQRHTANFLYSLYDSVMSKYANLYSDISFQKRRKA